MNNEKLEEFECDKCCNVVKSIKYNLNGYGQYCENCINIIGQEEMDIYDN